MNSAAGNRAVTDVVATYRAGPVEFDLAGTMVSTWGYAGSLPGMPLRARAGDLVEVTIDNALEEATSGGDASGWIDRERTTP